MLTKTAAIAFLDKFRFRFRPACKFERYGVDTSCERAVRGEFNKSRANAVIKPDAFLQQQHVHADDMT